MMLFILALVALMTLTPWQLFQSMCGSYAFGPQCPSYYIPQYPPQYSPIQPPVTIIVIR